MPEPGPQDDPTIPDDAVVWRRIPAREPMRWVVPDANANRLRPSSQAFKDNRNGPFSVFLEGECGGTDAVLAGLDGFAIASVPVRLLRSLGLGVVRDYEHGGPGHCLVTGRKTASVSTRIAAASEWVIPPPA